MDERKNIGEEISRRLQNLLLGRIESPNLSPVKHNLYDYEPRAAKTVEMESLAKKLFLRNSK